MSTYEEFANAFIVNSSFAGKALTVQGSGKVQQVMEKSTVSATAATGTVQFDALTQAVVYYTSNASGNWTLNIRGNASVSLNSIMATGESLTVTFLVTQGSTAYYNNALTIDGASITPKWQSFVPSSGNANGVDVYSYVVFKTGNAAFTVFASQTEFL